jgi:pyruvyltransferase
VIQRALRPGDVVWGSGLIVEQPTPVPAGATFLAVRGPLTRACIEGPVPAIYGDPALLLPRMVDAAPRRDGIGLVPHYFDQSTIGEPTGATLIDVRRPWQEVVRTITGCELVVSSSLHGVIVAEAYGIPAVWMTVPGGRERSPFKYHDHLAATGREPVEPWAWRGSLAGAADAALAPPSGLAGLADGLLAAWARAARAPMDDGADG